MLIQRNQSNQVSELYQENCGVFIFRVKRAQVQFDRSGCPWFKLQVCTPYVSLLPRHDVHRPLMFLKYCKKYILMSHEYYHSAGSFNFRNCWFPLMETNGAVFVPHKSIFSLSCRTNSSCNETETYFYLAVTTAETIWLSVLMRFHLYMKLIFISLSIAWICDNVFFLLFWCVYLIICHR